MSFGALVHHHQALKARKHRDIVCGDEDRAVDADLVYRRYHLVTRDVIGPVRHAVPRSLRSVRLIGVDLGIDNRHRNSSLVRHCSRFKAPFLSFKPEGFVRMPAGRDQYGQVTTSIASALTRGLTPQVVDLSGTKHL